MEVFSFSRRRLLADVTTQINMSHSNLPPPALLVQWEIESSLGGGNTRAFPSFLKLYNKLTERSGLCCTGLGDFTPRSEMIKDYEDKEITD